MRPLSSRFLPVSLIGLCLLGVSLSAKADLLLDANPGGTQIDCGSCGVGNGETFGYAFTLSQSYTVNGLGVWDSGADGIGASVLAGLWTSTGTLLASATVTNASTAVASASSLGQWLFEDISALVLGPGTYLIGAVFHTTEPLANVGDFTTAAGVSGVSGRVGLGPDSGFTVPTNAFSDAILGPTLRIATSNVPEPDSLLLSAVAGLALLGANRRKA